uniref:RING-type domain-containing protein n=1 Tax=Oryzias sinensis TaxID=183150 RepID=A0A8C7Y601_9TELE
LDLLKNKINLDQETFCCSICLDLLKDPVTIPCGHTIKSCLICLASYCEKHLQ